MTTDAKGWTQPWIGEATAAQVRHWVEEHRIVLANRLASFDRTLAMGAFKVANVQRTRMEEQRALVILEMGILETLWANHERWRLAHDGFVALPPGIDVVDGKPHGAAIVYHSGPMNEIATELSGWLPRDEHGNVPDVTPIFDRMREAYEK